MTNEEYVIRLGKLYDKVMSIRKDSDYVVNQQQMDRLVDIMTFFLDKAEELDGKVNRINLTPKEEHGGVTATFIVFDIYGDDVKRFCDVMQYASAITIDSTEDGVCISITIPNVFSHK